MSRLKRDIYYNDSEELVIFTYKVYTEKETKKIREKIFSSAEKIAEEATACIPQPIPDWLKIDK